MSSLNRPKRWLVVVVELVFTAALVIIAVLLWRDVYYDIRSAVGGRTLVSTGMHEGLAGGCIGLCLLATFLFLDAIRQSLLAAHAGGRRAEARELAELQRREEDERAGLGET